MASFSRHSGDNSQKEQSKTHLYTLTLCLRQNEPYPSPSEVLVIIPYCIQIYLNPLSFCFCFGLYGYHLCPLIPESSLDISINTSITLHIVFSNFHTTNLHAAAPVDLIGNRLVIYLLFKLISNHMCFYTSSDTFQYHMEVFHHWTM